MILEHFLLSINETNCYVVACSETNQAVVIDPGEWNGQLAGFLEDQSLELKAILLTHSHHDHTGGISSLVEQYPVPVVGHVEGSATNQPIADGEIFELGSLKIKALETPGHTEDSISFVVGCNIFCGDLIFAGSVGGVSNQDEYDTELHSIREKVLPLGDDMVLHPGHGPASTVMLERLYNPFLMP